MHVITFCAEYSAEAWILRDRSFFAYFQVSDPPVGMYDL